ncbi:MAG: hypothetical protein NC489_11590 [Ruminococcus flavefaciens]|nr:hypothetical protein [Ruminococcus flavefaciens]
MDYMSDGEIITFYRQAADPKKQIGILAELNATTKETITWILRRAGVYGKVDSSPKITPPRSRLPLLLLHHLLLLKHQRKRGTEEVEVNQ